MTRKLSPEAAPTTQTPPPVNPLVLSEGDKALFKRRILLDPWWFATYVCGYGEKAIERIHRPLLYIMTRKADLLAATLTDERYEGAITDAVIEDLRQHHLAPDAPEVVRYLAKRLRRVQIRMPRGAGKSIMADVSDLYEATENPDRCISLGSKSDDFAVDRVSAMGQIVMSPAYGFWFPERIPERPDRDIRADAIKLGGRTRPHVEATIEGRGITSQWAGYHYTKNRRDDMVGTESGEASLHDALKHIADMSSLRDKIYWEGDLFIGTVTGENDDFSLLLRDEGVLSIVMPMEEHDGGTTIENVMSDGTLTMAEWDSFNRDGVNEIKQEARANPEHGLIYLLQNFYMTAHKAGALMFTRRMLDGSLYRQLKNKETKEVLLLRPKKGLEKSCMLQWPDPLGAYERAGKHKFKSTDWFILNPATLSDYSFGIAVDQSISESGTSDSWAIALVCLDWEGGFWILDVEKGSGYMNMIERIPEFARRRSCKIGMDANATQGMTIEWLKRGEEFGAFSRRVVAIRSNGEAKDVNIRNYIQSRMLAGDLWINPELIDFHSELLRYRPRKADGSKRRKAVDDQLDAVWMALTLPVRPISPEDEEADRVNSFVASEREQRETDPVTHVRLGSWSDAIDWNTDIF